ncbi:hypothetical protein llap_21070 [Limosa lapponica baueri]|uniref:Uncharacterized protein n=1 Tax=Limosa lapponica baueri TaxID=1758121 RepID=A0A2I0T4A4_LIMLA|nr:hypothetical protein llap_21070 [Limosa lapponica baueri]
MRQALPVLISQRWVPLADEVGCGPLVGDQQMPRRMLDPEPAEAPFMNWKAAIRSPWTPLFFRLNPPNSLTLSSQQRGSSPLIVFVASSGPAPTVPLLAFLRSVMIGKILHHPIVL